MRIASVEVIPYALPFREPYVTARGSSSGARWCCCGCATRRGSSGWAKRCRCRCAAARRWRRSSRSWRACGELGDRRDEAERRRAATPSPARRAPARCAALTALLDLRGQARAAERRRALGAEPRRCRCNATLVAGEPGAVAADAQRWAEDGFTTFKLKLGAGEDVGAGARRCARRVGPEARIRVDANAAWDLETAKRMLAELEPLGIELAEQPVATLEEMARARGADRDPDRRPTRASRAAPTPSGPCALGACALTGIKLSKVGGPEAALAIAERAARLRLQRPRRAGRDRRRRPGRPDAAPRPGPAAPSSPTASPPSASSPRRSPRSSASCATACSTSPGPGLGVEIDEEALRRPPALACAVDLSHP